MGKEMRQPSTPRTAPYPPSTPTAQQQQYGQPSWATMHSGASSPAPSTGTSHLSRSSPPRATPGSSSGYSAHGSTTGSTSSTGGVIDPSLFNLLDHGLVSHTFGSKLANAFFREVFADTVAHRDPSTQTQGRSPTASYRHIDRAFVRRPTWRVDDTGSEIAVIDYALDERCGKVIRYNSAGADWKPHRHFSLEAHKPGLIWFQSRVGGAGIKLGLCENSEFAYHFLSVPQGQRSLCKLSKGRHCNLRVKWKGFPDKLYQIKSLHEKFGRDLLISELAAVVGAQVLRYFADEVKNVPRLDPVNDVIVLGLINLNEDEWSVMLQHCPRELRMVPVAPVYPSPPGTYPQAQEQLPPPVWALQMLSRPDNFETASIASGSSGSGLSATTTLAGGGYEGRKHKYAGSVASSASPGYAPSYSSASPRSQYSGDRDDASTIEGKYNYHTH